MGELIYLDHNATTPLDERVLAQMLPFFRELYGNAASTHVFGQKARKAVEKARTQCANAIGALPEEIIFTSGATEAINLALKGLVQANPSRRHAITVQTEHKAVLDVMEYLETLGVEVSYLPVDKKGLISIEDFQQAVRPDTLFAAVMWVNNETGVIQPIEEIGRYCQEAKVYFFTDATQAVGKLPIDLAQVPIDLLSFSAHKCYGPKGIGGLYVRKYGHSTPKIHPLLHGGGHERGFRSGTLDVPAIVGLGAALELAYQVLADDVKRIITIRDQLEAALLALPGTFVNGNRNHRLWNVCNLCFPGLEGPMAVRMLSDLALSNGSACTAAVERPSHVLRAMGLSDAEAFGSIRFSLGRGNKVEEVEEVVKQVGKLLT